MSGISFVRRSTRVAAATAAIALATTTGALASPVRGDNGIGDPYYPIYGNGGYDVEHYAIDVGYVPWTGRLTGTTRITAKATQDLASFNLDFVLDASRVTVNGVPATTTHTNPHELVVRPATPIAKGSRMEVSVTYAGVPRDRVVNRYSPFITTRPGGGLALGEPEISAWWFPGNDHPRDKATYDITLHVPKGWEGISNGRLVSKVAGAQADTWRWKVSQPMATYLAFMAVDQYDVSFGTTKTGTYWLNAVASGNSPGTKNAKADLARTPEVVDWLASNFGPYPFTEMGGVAPNAAFGFALETQTRPVYSRLFWDSGSNMEVVVHEMAHQWYGDSVSVTNWKDIWLNEGFATFSTFLWNEQHDGPTAQELLAAYYTGIPKNSEFWRVQIGNPGAGNEFNSAVYMRGAMTLQALRNRIGDEHFFDVMQTWASYKRNGNGAIWEFRSLAERISGQDLGGFFRNWLYSSTRPAGTTENGLKGIWHVLPSGEAAASARADGDRAAKAQAASERIERLVSQLSSKNG